MDIIQGYYPWISFMDIIHGYHRSLGRSVARSLARSLARSPAQYLYVFIKNTRQNIFFGGGGTVKKTSCANFFFDLGNLSPTSVSGEGGDFLIFLSHYLGDG